MVSVERVRPGLFCAHISQLNANGLTAKDDSIANGKPAMAFETSATNKKPTPIFGFTFGDKPIGKLHYNSNSSNTVL